jgi:ribosomal RNA-processing protein 12
MEEALSKIRPHTSSSLPNQKTPAQLLIALEQTFREQNTDPTPTAYFAAILTTLDGSIQKKELALEEGAILPAELYLIALVAPFVPAPIIRTNLNTVLSLTAPLFPALNQHPPALRSQLSLYHCIFSSLDKTQLDVQGVRQCFATILQLCLDPRPKVRKKAADIVKNLLSSPPIPLMRHPYSERVSDWIKSTLTDASATPFGKGKGVKYSAVPGADVALHVLACLKPIMPYLPPEVCGIYIISFCHSFFFSNVVPPDNHKSHSDPSTPWKYLPFPVILFHTVRHVCCFSRRYLN